MVLPPSSLKNPSRQGRNPRTGDADRWLVGGSLYRGGRGGGGVPPTVCRPKHPAIGPAPPRRRAPTLVTYDQQCRVFHLAVARTGCRLLSGLVHGWGIGPAVVPRQQACGPSVDCAGPTKVGGRVVKPHSGQGKRICLPCVHGEWTAPGRVCNRVRLPRPLPPVVYCWCHSIVVKIYLKPKTLVYKFIFDGYIHL